MSKEKLTIENLAPYLPYDLEVYLFERRYTITGVTQETLLTKQGAVLNYANSDSEIKIILRPFSDLINQIDHNREKFVPLKVLNEYMPLFGDVYEIYIDDNSDVRLLANYQKGMDVIRAFDPKNMLMKWHFDVFGLIEKGLAINMNDLKDE